MAYWRMLALVPMVGAVAVGQDAPLAFDVATIKFHPEPITLSADPIARGRTVTSIASTLADLLTSAYGVRYDQISGIPSWADSAHYDIVAKAAGEGALTRQETQQMLQALLAERFHLAFHRETKEMPAYALVIAKSGHKLKQSAADAQGKNGTRTSASGLHMEYTRGTMEGLASQLSHSAGRRVVDRTGLAGYWTFTFDFVPVTRPSGPDSDAPSMFTAIQEQLGLKLEPVKAPFEMLVVDRAEKPSEN